MTKNFIRGIPVEVGDKLRSGDTLIEVTELPIDSYFFSARVLESHNEFTGSSDGFYKPSWFAEAAAIQLIKSTACFRPGDVVHYDKVTVMVTGSGAVEGYNFAGVVIRIEHGYGGNLHVGDYKTDFIITAYSTLTVPVEVMGRKADYPFGIGDLVKRKNSTNADFIIRVTEMNSDPFDYPDKLFAGTIIARDDVDQTYVGETRTAFYIKDYARVEAVTKYEFVEGE